MRRALAVLALLAGVALVLAPAGPAYADPGGNNTKRPGVEGDRGNNDPGQSTTNSHGSEAPSRNGVATNDPPGFNGTIKIHEGDSEDEPIVANEPRIGCAGLHVHGFNFDRGAGGTWRIVAWEPTGDKTTVVASGTWTGDANGGWRTAVMTLASGHYKTFADQNGAPGGEKHKVFWVQCGAQAPASPSSASPASAPPSTAPPASAPPSSAPPASAPPSSAPPASAPPSTAPPASAPPTQAASTSSPTPTQLGVEQPPAAAVAPRAGTPAAAAPIVAGVEVPPGAEVPAVGALIQQGEVTQPAAMQQPAQMAAQSSEIAMLPSTSTAGGMTGSAVLFLIFVNLAAGMRRMH